MKKLLFTSLFLLFPLTAYSQTIVVNANSSIQFNASVDHNTVVNGVTILTGYRLETNIFTTQLGALQFSKQLGKPTPGAGNVITIVIPEFGTIPQGGYEARVYAVGPGGENATSFTSPFVRVNSPTAPTALTIIP